MEINEKKPDILKTDLMIAGVCVGALVGAWYVGKRAGLKEGYVYGTLAAYDKVLEALSSW